ncbi:hypothetical protein [Chitinolyticbacter meiyuanensis]|uniref:hypothetical protein n=1 Tax=Chitinolyticbacter meiyuanensis TaxID=682798 RepID=UPI0011E5CB7F|nr:hypothetical protein [Chitinolyticbacter meiyuanensis]
MSSDKRRSKNTATAPTKPSNTLFNYYSKQPSVNEKRSNETAFTKEDGDQQAKKVKIDTTPQDSPSLQTSTSFPQIPNSPTFSTPLFPPVQIGQSGPTLQPIKPTLDFAEISKQAQLKKALTPMFPEQKGEKTESHSTFKELFTTKGATKARYQDYKLSDPNNKRLIEAIKQNKKAFKKAAPDDHENIAGYINEARALDRTLRKYNKMPSVEQAKRQYYPQTTISSPLVTTGNRRPDLLKIKTTEAGPLATFTEIKSKTFKTGQREDTLSILQDTKTISAVPPGFSKIHSPVDLTKAPVTKYKTIFAGSFSKKNPDHPLDPGASQLTPKTNGKATITGTGISVYSKRTANKEK